MKKHCKTILCACAVAFFAVVFAFFCAKSETEPEKETSFLLGHAFLELCDFATLYHSIYEEIPIERNCEVDAPRVELLCWMRRNYVLVSACGETELLKMEHKGFIPKGLAKNYQSVLEDAERILRAEYFAWNKYRTHMGEPSENRMEFEKRLAGEVDFIRGALFSGDMSEYQKITKRELLKIINDSRETTPEICE